MDNVPSSAILAIIAIVASCMIGAFVFSVVTSQRQQGNKAMKTTEEMQVALDESKYTVYDGATVTGSQVLSAIQQFKDQPIAISVNNGSSTVAYIYTTAPDFSATTFDLGGATKMTSAQFSQALVAAQNPAASATYITPSAQFVGIVIRNDATKAISGLAFQPVNATITPAPGP